MIYHINPEKRTVCCRMPANDKDKNTYLSLWEEARNQAIAKMSRYVRSCQNGVINYNWAIGELVNHIFYKRMGNTDYFGVAHCHPKDEFDVEKGKEIARNKALMSYYKDMELCMKEAADLFHTLHEMAADKAEECYLYEERLAIRQENF